MPALVLSFNFLVPITINTIPLTKKGIDIGFIEAKDIGDSDLEGTRKSGNKEQFDRYKASLNNLIFTRIKQNS